MASTIPRTSPPCGGARGGRARQAGPDSRSRDGGRVNQRNAPLDLPPEEFRRLGHDLVDRMADLLGTMRERPLTPGETPAQVRALLGRAPLPEQGTAAGALLDEITPLL